MPNGLKGARIGLLTDFIGADPIHQDVNRVVESAVARMTALGATVVRVSIPNLDELTRGLNLMNLEFKAAFDRYLAGLGPVSPVKSLEEFVARGQFHESMRRGLEARSENHRRARARPSTSACSRGATRCARR